MTPVEMGLIRPLCLCFKGAQFAMLALIAVQAPVTAMTVFLINLRLFAELACVDLFPSYQSLAKYRYV